MNFKYMNKEAWLLDEGVLYKGIVKRKLMRHIFVPNSHAGGLSYQYVYKKDIGKILFRNDIHIVYAGFGHIKRIDDEIEPECDYCIHKGKDFINDEPCYSCCNPDDSKVVLGFELDATRYNEIMKR